MAGSGLSGARGTCIAEVRGSAAAAAAAEAAWGLREPEAEGMARLEQLSGFAMGVKLDLLLVLAMVAAMAEKLGNLVRGMAEEKPELSTVGNAGLRGAVKLEPHLGLASAEKPEPRVMARWVLTLGLAMEAKLGLLLVLLMEAELESLVAGMAMKAGNLVRAKAAEEPGLSTVGKAGIRGAVKLELPLGLAAAERPEPRVKARWVLPLELAMAAKLGLLLVLLMVAGMEMKAGNLVRAMAANLLGLAEKQGNLVRTMAAEEPGLSGVGKAGLQVAVKLELPDRKSVV